MDLEMLDKKLRTLTESEKRYMEGQHYDNWNSLDTIMINDRPVFLLNFFASDYSSSRNLNQNKILELDLNVRKHSRFNAVPMHIHDYIEINYVYSGSCPQIVNETEIILEKGQVLFIDTNTPHSIPALLEDDIMINLLISKNYLHNNLFSHFSTDSILSQFFINTMNERTQTNKYLLFHSESSRRISMFFNEFLCEFYDPSLNSTDILTNLFGLIIAELINVYKSEMTKEAHKKGAASVIMIIKYIESNYKHCTLDSVSEFFHLNPNYITTLLKKHTGYTYKQLIQTQKLKYAAKLLKNTNLSVTEIANEAGYENVSFFYKKFVERYNVKPKDYRD